MELAVKRSQVGINPASSVPAQVVHEVQQVLEVAAHRQARNNTRSPDDPWQQKGAYTAISAFFELLCAYPGGVTPAMLQTHCLEEMHPQASQPATMGPAPKQAQQCQDFRVGEAEPCCEGAGAFRLQPICPSQRSSPWLLHSCLMADGRFRSWSGATVRMASSEALPCIHRPGKGARKASAPEYITPGQCFVLLVDSLQRARALAGIPVMQDGMHSQSPSGHGHAPLHMNARVEGLSPAPQDAQILLQPPCSQGAAEQGVRLQLSSDLAGLTLLLSVGDHILVTHVQLTEHPVHGPCMQMTPHSLIICIASPTSRSPLGAIGRQSPLAPSPQGALHPPARGKENRPVGGHAKGAKLHKHAAASVCKLAGPPNRQPSASEGCRSGAAAAGLLVGTLVSCCRGTAPTEFELQLQGSEGSHCMTTLVTATCCSSVAAHALLSLRPGHCIALTGVQAPTAAGSFSSYTSLTWEQGRAGALLCNLSTLPALLTSPMFHAGIAPLESVLDQMLSGWEDVQQPRLVTGTMQHAPEVGVQRNHLPCGHAVEEASLGDLFEEDDFDMCGESNPAPATAGPGNGTLWSCKFCGVECGLAATGLAFSGHVRVHGGTGVWLDSPAIMGLLGAPATVYGSLSPDRQSAQNQSCIGRSYTAALYCQPCDSGSHAQPAFSGLVLTS